MGAEFAAILHGSAVLKRGKGLPRVPPHSSATVAFTHSVRPGSFTRSVCS